MTNSNLSLIIADDIAAHSYYEGMLLHPTNPIHGMAVMRSNASDLILDIYKLSLHDQTAYHIDHHLFHQEFATEIDVQSFIQKFSTFKESDFNAIIQNYDKRYN
ncbi:hypothetical protein [Paraliobacillus sediminis]|uniref:hypothetical protein n=1 Tax=Paraliobacillus sediminis TaxID=1885916 RepID=UPI000E3DF362|nr:hypothetical protein [Paraliobacillus sediminis]